MAETRGYSSINDRTSGYGAGYGAGGPGTIGYVDPALQPTADPVVEFQQGRDTDRDGDISTAAEKALLGRWERTLTSRKSAKADNHSAIADRSAGVGNGGYGYGSGDTWTTGAVIGTDDELEAATGTNVVLDENHADVRGYNRALHDGPAAILDDSTAAKRDEAARKSVRDRTDGWDHEDVKATYARAQSGAFNADTGKWADEAAVSNSNFKTYRED